MHIFLAILLLLLGLWLWRRQRIRLHRDALLRPPIPDFARDIIAQDVPLIAKLPSELHRSLEGKINRFDFEAAIDILRSFEQPDQRQTERMR